MFLLLYLSDVLKNLLQYFLFACIIFFFPVYLYNKIFCSVYHQLQLLFEPNILPSPPPPPPFLCTVTGAYNIGIFHWRPTEPAKRLAKDWKDLLLSDDTLWDQNAFNDLIHKKFGYPVVGEDELVYSYDGKLKLGVLPASIFCSGHTYFVQVVALICLKLAN